ncbi:MAG: hypothetical protein JWM91_2295 [Rhodospirillales bacterium]|nr:hypothetical protein [Rhodospirillales bacterium]
MPLGVGYSEPVALTLAVDDWARTVRKWSGLLNVKPAVTDFTNDKRKRARFASRSFVTMDLIEAGLDVFAGDTELTLLVPDVAGRAAALKTLGLSVEADRATGDARLAARHASGIDILFTAKRPEPVAQAMMPLPYVLDISVNDIAAIAPVWDAIMGIEGTYTSIETDSARQFAMRHYVTAGEMHAIGLMQIASGIFVKRDSLGSSHVHVLKTHGEGTLCIGFLYKTDLDAHIANIPADIRDLLIFEEPRSYQMGRNNMSHADQTGGVSVILAQHFEGWGGDPREARADK